MYTLIHTEFTVACCVCCSTREEGNAVVMKLEAPPRTHSPSHRWLPRVKASDADGADLRGRTLQTCHNEREDPITPRHTPCRLYAVRATAGICYEAQATFVGYRSTLCFAPSLSTPSSQCHEPILPSPFLSQFARRRRVSCTSRRCLPQRYRRFQNCGGRSCGSSTCKRKSHAGQAVSTSFGQNACATVGRRF